VRISGLHTVKAARWCNGVTTANQQQSGPNMAEVLDER
jgi:hypothetical protein